MIDFDAAQVRSHRRNIERYCRLLVTELTDLERQYLHKRIADEAIREGARKAGSAATQQTSAPATDDSSVERSDELFAELKTDLFAANADG